VRLGRESEAALLRDILVQEYQLPLALVDTLELPPLTPPTTISQSDMNEAEKWLKGK